MANPVRQTQQRHPEPSPSRTGKVVQRALLPLTHPIWWCALSILLLNDHYLKGAAILPSWATGKISDFMGLVVAPALAVALFRARSRPARTVAFGVVVVPFVIINVSSGAASLVERATASLGIHWRIWTDPTDLVALAVLPVTAWLITGSWSSPHRLAASVRIRLAHLGAVVGALACLGTSSAYEEIEASTYLVNATHESRVVWTYRVASALDCTVVAIEPRSMLTASQFVLDSCKRQAPFVILPLDADWIETTPGAENTRGGHGESRACDAVVLRIDGMADMVVFWNQLPKIRFSTSGYQVRLNEIDDRALYIEAVGERLFVDPNPNVEMWHVTWDLPLGGVACGDAP